MPGRSYLHDETQRMMRPVLIAGPTASGKSAVALELAARRGGVIINADSMQVYRDLRVITARPSREEELRAPHRLYGHVDAAETYSAGRWLEDVGVALAEANVAGTPPIIVGGTGLYFRLLTTGIAAVPPIPRQIRDRLRARLEAEGAPALHAELADRDPASATRLSPRDRSRVVRALEVIEATGRSLHAWHGESAAPLVAPDSAAKLFLAPERDSLRSRIETRFDAMLAAGAGEEVRALAARGIDPLMPAMKAHGVPWLIRHFRGEIDLEEAAVQAKADTRRYAKRQFTWFRNQLADWPWSPPETALQNLLAQLDA
jgi:tRNA dimethylallyltransferase